PSHVGEPPCPLLRAPWDRGAGDPELTGEARRMLRLAAAMDAVPSAYFQYYYLEVEVLAELQAKGTQRAEDILSWVPDYWRHYEEEATTADPHLDPSRARGA